jgi:cardiolipin synthase
MHRPDPISPCRPTLDPAALEKELHHLSGDPLRPAGVQIQVDGSEAIAALHEVIDGAIHRIDVLMFLWDNDPLGREIAERLAAKASPTCRVRVLVDGGGNLMQGEPREASAAELNRVVSWLAKQPHVEVIRTRDPFLMFDHRKLVLADGCVGWSGGRNFTYAAFHDHHDLSYTLNGPLAEELGQRFEKFWLEQGGQAAEATDPAPPASDETLARLVATRPRERQLAAVLYHTIDRARDHVYVENPYLTDSLLLSKLAKARRRGTDVRVVLTLQSDSDIINRANRVTVNRLLAAGVRVYLYPGMTHVKATAVDGVWVYMGTANFDPLSLRHNRELGLAISAGPVIESLENELFLPDFNPEWEQGKRLRLTPTDYAAEALASLFL